jgi:6-phosphogluconolactonase
MLAANQELKVYAGPEELAAKSALAIARTAAECIRQRGKFTLVLAGGSTPRRTYELLARGEGEHSIDWSRVFLFFGDERFVPHDDPRSNYKLAHDTLLSAAPIASEQVLAVDTSLASPAASAGDYAARVAQFFALPRGTMPAFDMILLGLGDDGHTASLFPHASALKVHDETVTWSPPGVLPPPVDRITLTLPVLNAAHQVMFLVSGAGKAEVVAEVLSGRAKYEDHPAAGVRAKAGRISWLLDRAAAANLPHETSG